MNYLKEYSLSIDEIEQCRKILGMSIEDISNYAGITRQTYSNILHGRSKPQLTTRVALTKVIEYFKNEEPYKSRLEESKKVLECMSKALDTIERLNLSFFFFSHFKHLVL